MFAFFVLTSLAATSRPASADKGKTVRWKAHAWVVQAYDSKDGRNQSMVRQLIRERDPGPFSVAREVTDASLCFEGRAYYLQEVGLWACAAAFEDLRGATPQTVSASRKKARGSDENPILAKIRAQEEEMQAEAIAMTGEQPAAEEQAVKTTPASQKSAKMKLREEKDMADAPVSEITAYQNKTKKSAKKEAKENSLHLPLELQLFREAVEKGGKQRIHANQREFIALSRNYINRIHCEGEITKLVPPPVGLIDSVDLENEGQDLFLRIADKTPQDFPIDLNIICSGATYLLNGVVHSGLPTQDIELVLPEGAKNKVALRKFTKDIKEASALPLEEKVAKVLQRIYKGEFLPYWESETGQAIKKRGFGSMLLSQVVHTNIEGLTGWDFIFSGNPNKEEIIMQSGRVVSGRLVGYGKVNLGDSCRVIVLTQEDQPDWEVPSGLH